ncbi:phosphodiester glycosidase family protein [Desulforamulus ruminis]|uniref:Copper amine oxidase-like domain-containing protein n=1 Tax=Desulforamulus ruminis (strain ATCC 23193 / DSM 2154 / NCIMB 8452 / DL) TaxID=696281 RepID=F6DNG3_DESRL|nr:phosphodiester glycosidase family protein [Desulforamulus ruminis]AEG61854.1 copper amine oxidase-like domain-containing protein [Desulforamulus ruminis DSM 2154]
MKLTTWFRLLCICFIVTWALPAAAAEQIAPGVRYWSFERTNWDGKPVKGHALEIDLQQRFTEVWPVMGQDQLGKLETLSSMTGRTGAIAAINGGFFDTRTGIPDGTLMIDGKTVTTTNILRTTLGITSDGEVKVGYYTPGSEEWQKARHLLTGGPLLVKDGLPVDQAVQEGLWGNVLSAAPRTAVGVTASGRLLLVEVDGRQANYSQGVTLEELSYLMIDLGAVQAVGLDGGGSSEMIVKGNIVNRPSDGKERSISNGLVVLQQLPVYLNNQRLFFDVPPLVEKGRTLVPMRRIFEGLGAEVAWDDATKKVTATKGSRSVELTLGEAVALVDGEKVALDVPAQLMAGRLLVPMRFVGESLGATVNYDTTATSPVIYITEEGGSTSENQ